MELTSQNVHDVLMDCLLDEVEYEPLYGDNKPEFKVVQGLVISVVLSAERVEKRKTDIIDMLNELPDSFKSASGGGMSFLKMCDNKHGEQWTGFQRSMEELVILGLATNLVTFPLPREFWSALPLGAPYIIVNL